MYPYFRTLKILATSKFQKKITFSDKSSFTTRVWFSDIDFYPELNNGRHLTLMDLGRLDFGYKIGLFKVLSDNKWGLMVAGNFTRYRRRIKFLQKFKLETELVGYDDRWYYFYQQTTRKGIIHSSALVRTAIVSKDGIVSAEKVSHELGVVYDPKVPDWVKQWIHLNEISPSLN